MFTCRLILTHGLSMVRTILKHRRSFPRSKVRLNVDFQNYVHVYIYKVRFRRPHPDPNLVCCSMFQCNVCRHGRLQVSKLSLLHKNKFIASSSI